MAISKQKDDLSPAYRSGAAAKLAGIPVETLRVWERRYGVVGPRHTPRGHRLYSTEDVSRLALIKQLVDLGNSIGTIASLPFPALRELRAGADQVSRSVTAVSDGPLGPVRVAIVGEALAVAAQRDGRTYPALEIVATCAVAGNAMAAMRDVAADVLAVELPTLQSDDVSLVGAIAEAIGARHVVVAYRFGPAAAVRALHERGHVVTRSPLDIAELNRLCRKAAPRDARSVRSGSAPEPLETVPNRRFDESALARLAHASTAMYCDCPRHVIELLQSLGGFERYSAECETDSPADAVLHQYLERVAGTARALFEDALERVALAGRITLEDGASGSK